MIVTLYTFGSVTPYSWKNHKGGKRLIEIDVYGSMVNNVNFFSADQHTSIAMEVMEDCLAMARVPEVYPMGYNKRRHTRISFYVCEKTAEKFSKLCDTYGNDFFCTLEALFLNRVAVRCMEINFNSAK